MRSRGKLFSKKFSPYDFVKVATLIKKLYEGIISLEGQAVKGDEFMEYYIDESAAQATVVELFYELRD